MRVVSFWLTFATSSLPSEKVGILDPASAPRSMRANVQWRSWSERNPSWSSHAS